jgi:DNA polymerase-3 subunit gamma/tau
MQSGAQTAPKTAALPAQEAGPRAAPRATPNVELNSLEDIVALAATRGAAVLKVNLENDVHLVSLERGRIEFRPSARARSTLAQDLAQKLRDWTGERWIVTLASDGGAPSIAETRAGAERAKRDAVASTTFVRAVLDAFPGAEIVAVRERDDATAPEEPSDSEEPE